MRFELAAGWHLLRVQVGDAHEWIICDPDGDRLGDTAKHKAELDAALLAVIAPNVEGTKVLGVYPPGTKFARHPAGGYFVAHPDHPLRWAKPDGTVEVIKPADPNP